MIASSKIPTTVQRRWGYLVWVVAGIVIGVPEIMAAVDNGALPFTTISGMTGHLERRHNWVELIVVAAIVFVIFSTIRVSPRTRSGVVKANDGQPVRTPGGRLTLRDPSSSPEEFDDAQAPVLFGLAAVFSLAAIAVATWAATQWWDTGPKHYQPAYVLYGSLGLLWLVLPSILAFVFAKDMPFPTLFRTITNLEDWLKTRTWRWSMGPTLAWLVSYMILTGLVILLLHLALYPYPDITKVLNPTG